MTMPWGRAALEEIGVNRSRSLLAFLSVVLGVWSVTVIVAAGTIATAALVQNLEETLGRPATISISVTQLPPGWTDAALRARLSEAAGLYGIHAASPLESVPVVAGSSSRRQSISLMGIAPSLDRIDETRVIAGRWLSKPDAMALAPMLVLNTAAVTQLGFTSSARAVGGLIRLWTLTPVMGRVVGVVQAPPNATAEAFMPARVLERWGAPVGTSLAFSYVVRVDPSAAANTIGLMKFDLARWGVGEGTTVQRTDQTAQFSSGLLAIQLVLAGIAGIALLTGGMGVLNLGLVSVRERVHEFGIRRVFGATRWHLFVMVLAEAVVTTTAAGIAGVLLAVLSVALLPSLLASISPGDSVQASFPWGAAAIGIGLAFALGLLAGIIPARRATQADIVQALRGN